MEGHEAGDSSAWTSSPPTPTASAARAMGQRIPKKHFGNQPLQPGMQVVLNTNMGPRAVTIEKVGMTVVDVDLNHPMAGRTCISTSTSSTCAKPRRRNWSTTTCTATVATRADPRLGTDPGFARKPRARP